MSMKSTNSPRRVYSRNDITHVLFAGTVFGPTTPGQYSSVRLDTPVRISGNGDGTITVVQRRPHAKTVTEVWGQVNVPCKSR